MMTAMTHDATRDLPVMPAARILRAYLQEAKYETLKLIRTPALILPFTVIPPAIYFLFGVLIIPTDDPTGEFTVFLEREGEHEYSLDHAGDHWFIRTNDQAENFRLMKTPTADTARSSWEEVIGHRDDVLLMGFELFADHLVVLDICPHPYDVLVCTSIETPAALVEAVNKTTANEKNRSILMEVPPLCCEIHVPRSEAPRSEVSRASSARIIGVSAQCCKLSHKHFCEPTASLRIGWPKKQHQPTD